MTPTMSALLRRGDEVVEQVRRENRARWQTLSEADRERLEALPAEVVARLLQAPVLRVETSQGDQSFHYARVLRELFGLETDRLRPTSS